MVERDRKTGSNSDNVKIYGELTDFMVFYGCFVSL